MTYKAEVAIIVKRYGAIGVGVTDDRQAFESATNDVSKDRKIFVPKGADKISSGINSYGKFVFNDGAFVLVNQTNQRFFPITAKKRFDFISPYKEQLKRHYTK